MNQDRINGLTVELPAKEQGVEVRLDFVLISAHPDEEVTVGVQSLARAWDVRNPCIYPAEAISLQAANRLTAVISLLDFHHTPQQ